MDYRKLLEVSEDYERVYFCFFISSGTKIIGIPKRNCDNHSIYIGKTFNELILTETDVAKDMLTDLMRGALASHPKSILCKTDSLKALTS